MQQHSSSWLNIMQYFIKGSLLGQTSCSRGGQDKGHSNSLLSLATNSYISKHKVKISNFGLSKFDLYQAKKKQMESEI